MTLCENSTHVLTILWDYKYHKQKSGTLFHNKKQVKFLFKSGWTSHELIFRNILTKNHKPYSKQEKISRQVQRAITN